MNEFKQVEETIKKEKEFYAKVNYFKLLIKLKYAKDTPEQLYNGIWKVKFLEANYEKFCLLDGINNVNQLLIDIKESNIDLSNSVSDIWEQLLNDFKTFGNILYGKSIVLVETLKDVKRLVHQYKIPNAASEIMGIDFLYVQLPPEVKMNTNLSKEIEEQKSKKIGER